ncbi:MULTISPECIES: hypothetical protein [unclassified Pseudactinotalea]|uniref:hypothetical protein n=1 Tax=Micrococcales TaxID=85006 RepID=UPI003C7BE6C0
MSKRRSSPTTIAIWSLVIAGLAVLQFPGILLYHDVAEPRILGMPFIYGFNLVVWAILCVVLFWAYKVHWGRPRPHTSDERFEAEVDQ